MGKWMAQQHRARLVTAFTFFTAASLYMPTDVLADCMEIHGSLTQGGLIWGTVPSESRVTLDGETLDVLQDGTTIAGFGRDAAATADLMVEDGAEVCRQTLQVTPRQYAVQQVHGVPQKTVTPPPEQLERIRQEQALVNSAKAQYLSRPDLLRDALAGFQWPTIGPISGVYGSQRYYNGAAGNPHYGIDVAVPTGTAVLAPAAGVVTLAEPDLFYSGGTVILDHGFRFSSAFLHLSKVLVEVGQEVNSGDVIGKVGATGRATGAHLDWRMNWRNHRIDPQLLAPTMPNP